MSVFLWYRAVGCTAGSPLVHRHQVLVLVDHRTSTGPASRPRAPPQQDLLLWPYAVVGHELAPRAVVRACRTMAWARVRLVRCSWLCTKTSTAAATSGGTRNTVTTDRRRPLRAWGTDGRAAHARHLRRFYVMSAVAMDITFVTTELAPFVKVGGLADVVRRPPKALRTWVTPSPS